MNEFYFQWHITNKCNNRCIHCYQDDFNKTCEMRDALFIIDEINDVCQELETQPIVAVTGGDPTLHDHFLDILKHLKYIGASIDIMGNPENPIAL